MKITISFEFESEDNMELVQEITRQSIRMAGNMEPTVAVKPRKPRPPLTDEQKEELKARLRAGREKAAAERAAEAKKVAKAPRTKAEAPAKPKVKPAAAKKPVVRKAPAKK